MVWSKPLSKLAQEFGVSDQGLAKACRRCQVPVPPVGYWQKLAHGKRVDQPRLENGQFSDDAIVQVAAGVKMRPKVASMPGVEQSNQKLLRSPQTSTEKPPAPHPMLAQIQKAFNKAKNPAELTLISVGAFKIRATPMRSERIIAIISTILAAGMSENWEVRTTKDREWDLLANDARIELAINENTRKVPHIPTPAEIRDQQRYSWNDIPEFDHVPSGEMKLTITNGSYLGVRTNWSDGKKQTLESVLPSLIEGISIVGAALYTRRLEREEREREWELQRKQEAERQRLRQIQHTRFAILKEQASQYHEAEKLRAYIGNVKLKLTSLPPNDRSGVEEWIAWAESSIEQLDPLSSGLPTLISEEDAVRDGWRYRDR
ncbi:hypothetical protein G6L35_13875 [Agrobacterium tumefaciens]|uniref:hypothetical protein n=1 Tax=Agrobacterium tumefaciens TaxID=358 RepID=UPI001572B0FE|nr:hypothetical protein [Agrobacterium tumefaciens]NSZ69720.1 hypothetical protein [Agrobacterium tumefaciens]